LNLRPLRPERSALAKLSYIPCAVDVSVGGELVNATRGSFWPLSDFGAHMHAARRSQYWLTLRNGRSSRDGNGVASESNFSLDSWKHRSPNRSLQQSEVRREIPACFGACSASKALRPSLEACCEFGLRLQNPTLQSADAPGGELHLRISRDHCDGLRFPEFDRRCHHAKNQGLAIPDKGHGHR
jgi:hypothetical protein